MKFLRLRIWNFLTIGHAEVHLDGKGLVLIQGENQDDPSALSNGAGKSSIADALMWALYGETARGESGDAVVNLTAKKDCYVELNMQDGDTFYEIQRYRKHTKLKNVTHVYAASGAPPADSAASVILSLHKGTEKETQEVINRIVGCSKEVFQAAIYAGQEQTPDLPGMTDKQLKMLIEEAAGVERLEAAYSVALSRKLGAEKAVEKLSGTVESTRGMIARYDASLKTAVESRDNFETDRTYELGVLRVKIAGHKSDAKQFAESAREIKDAGFEAIRDKIDEQINGLTDQSRKVDEWHDENVRPLENAYRKIDYEVARLTKQLAEVETHRSNIEAYLSVPCPTCKRPHDPSEREEQDGILKAQVDDLNAKLAKAISVRDDWKAKWDAGEAEYTKRLAAIPTSTELVDKRRRVDEKLAEMARWVKKAREAIAFAKELEAKHEALLTQANPYAANVGDHVKKIEECQANLKTQERELLECQHDLAIAQSVVQVFGPAGVRAHILDTVTPFLNDRTAEYLGVLSDGNINATWTTLTKNGKGELKEKFTIEVTNATGAQSFKGLSGGEKRKVRLACMLALQDLVATRATKPIDLWIGDEIDDALDASGLERLMTILDSKAREKGTVLVISHNDLKDWADNVATIVKKGGMSTVEGALC